MKMIGYHFVNDKLRDGRSIPKNGEWLEHKGPLKLCDAGLHWSKHPFDALTYAPGTVLCLVELAGETIHSTDKSVSERRRIIKRFDATEMLIGFARWQAYQVLELWSAPEIVKQYIYTGDKSLAEEAATEAARAAWAATEAATWAERASEATWAAEAAWASAAAEKVVRAARAAATEAATEAAWAARAAAEAARAATWAATWAAARVVGTGQNRDDFKFLVDLEFDKR
jgi:hypothetical protein